MAIKRLTASDLTFLEWHFRSGTSGAKQKSINLNADVLVDALYPVLPDIASQQKGRLSVDLTIHGPGLAAPENLQRKIVKGRGYKNWRLNGEFVRDPDGQAERFKGLTPGDLAVFEFIGTVAPTAVNLVFVAQSVEVDAPLHEELSGLLSGKSMVATDPLDFGEAVQRARLPEAHPARNLGDDDALEDAALGGSAGIDRLRRRPSLTLSTVDLESARQNAVRVGRLGEELLDSYFAQQVASGAVLEYEWTSSWNAVSPFDFRVKTRSSSHVLDAKSTIGEFDRPIHVSESELREMRSTELRYDLFRLYEVRRESAKLRICHDMKDWAELVLQALTALPRGVQADSVSVSPNILNFGQEIRVVASQADQEDQ